MGDPSPHSTVGSVDTILTSQTGVIGRGQALAAGLRPHDIRRMLRRREWAPMHRAVYVRHTGEPTWIQRAWGALLWAGHPVALAGESALRAECGPGSRWDETNIGLLVPAQRRLDPPKQMSLRRTELFDQQVRWNVHPPRQRVEYAALDLAADARSELQAISVLAAVVQGRLTTAARIRKALGTRSWTKRGRFLGDVLDDIAAGACSVLEVEYVRRVERPHGLPVAQRQVRAGSTMGLIFRDATLGSLLLELDGRLFHNTAEQRDRDMDRDLDAAVEGKDTRRLSYGQVLERSCWTAERIGRLLRNRGWDRAGHPCGIECGAGLEW